MSEKHSNIDHFRNHYKVINDRFKKYFQSDCDSGILYHYTDESAFLKIITSNEIRITNVNYFDDRLEYDYGIRLAIAILKELTNKNGYEEKFFYSIECEILKFYINRHYYYIFSSCLQNDNNYLSNNYAKQEGCCIGFDKEWLIEGDGNNGYIDNCDKSVSYTLGHGKVIYDKEEQNNIISEYITGLYETWRVLKSEILMEFLPMNLADYLLMFKTEDFKSEKEFRVVFNTFRNDFICNDTKKHYFLKFTNHYNNFRNPIETITFLKSNNIDLNSSKLFKFQRIFKKLGYEETKIAFHEDVN